MGGFDVGVSVVLEFGEVCGCVYGVCDGYCYGVYGGMIFEEVYVDVLV